MIWLLWIQKRNVMENNRGFYNGPSPMTMDGLENIIDNGGQVQNMGDSPKYLFTAGPVVQARQAQ